VVEIVRHADLLARLGLTTLAGARAFQGQLVKDHKGRRDIFRIPPAHASDQVQSPVLFLKRNWHPYKKDGLASLFRRGAVWSAARQEWENASLLAAAGLTAARPVAYGEECGWFWERFSFLVTEAAAGQTLHEFLRQCRDRSERRRVFDALAREVRRLHDAGLASPDLFTRHVFVDTTAHPPGFCWIDMARLDRERPLSRWRRARDLAALNVTAPMRFVSPRERVRFLGIYGGERKARRELAARIRRRVIYLLRRRKFRDFGQQISGQPSA
jgi:tRNA A-37 threonylcarbamoyl transferase component Bud32